MRWPSPRRAVPGRPASDGRARGRASPRSRTGERGIALLMVLWTLVLLSFVATVFGGNARTEVLLSRNLFDNAEAEALADAGVHRAIAGLTQTPEDGGFRGDGTIYVWATTDGEVRFRVRDEGGKVDLNQATPALLRELLVARRVPIDRAGAIADAIVDFRDDDDTRQPQGAEDREYRAADLPWRPKNQPFTHVEELVYVVGVTPDVYRSVQPFLTVYGGDEPHVPTADRPVRTALIAARNAPTRFAARTAADGTGDSRDRPGAGSGGERGAFGSGSGRGGSGFGEGGSAFGGSASSGSGGGSSGFGGGSSGFGSGRGGGTSGGSGGGSGGADASSGDDRRSGFSSGTGSAFGDGRSSGSAFGGSSRGTSGFGASADADADDPDALAEGEDEERSGIGIYAVHAEARTGNGTVFVRDAIVDFAGAEDTPFVFRAWRQGERELFPLEPADPAAAR